MFDDKTILVTGGTGSFGNSFIERLLTTASPKEIIVFSRDEKKQYEMRLALNNPLVTFVIGDVRDRESVFRILKGVDLVFHAAALKQVPSCEFFPFEAVKTNILGTGNVIDACERHGIETVVLLSTDKAVHPINAMGLTKSLAEKFVVAKAKATKSNTVFCAVRYGNVLYSRGSVVPLFVNQIKTGQPLTITNPAMTRFLLPLSVAVDLVIFALEHAKGGDIFVRKAPAASVLDLAKACLNIFGANNPIKTIGTREGEKVHEMLLTPEELSKALEMNDYFHVPCDRGLDYDEYFSRGKSVIRSPEEGYTSANTRRLDVNAVEELLKSLPEIQRELT
jgi:UDP-N-acetylglucosamine 4,6-dehydratase/5-epimerase